MRSSNFAARPLHVSCALVLCTALCALSGCAARGAGKQAPAHALDVPEELDAHAYAELRRAYRTLDPADAQRTRVRTRLVRYLLKEAEHVRAADEYDAAVERLAKIAGLYQPDELKTGLSPELLPLALTCASRASGAATRRACCRRFGSKPRCARTMPSPSSSTSCCARWRRGAREPRRERALLGPD